MASAEELFEVDEEAVWDEERLNEHALKLAHSYQRTYGKGPYRIVKISPNPSPAPLHPQMLHIEFEHGMVVDMSGSWFKHARQ